MLRRDLRASLIAAALVVAPELAPALTPQATTAAPRRVQRAPQTPQPAQQPQHQHPGHPVVEPVSHSTNVSSREASVTIGLADGTQLAIAMRDGTVFVNGNPVGPSPRGGALERGFRALLGRAGSLTTEELVFGLRSLPVGPETAVAWAAVARQLPEVPVTALPEAPAPPAIALPPVEVEVGERLRELAPEIAGQLDWDERPTFAPARVVTDIASLLGAVIALAALGFGAIFLVPQRLEVVADTVARSPGRSFLAGLCAQPLILPALATLLIALTLTVVGILVIPVAIVLYALALAAAIVGGYLAVARVVGEVYVKRRGLQGTYTSGWTTYRYLVYGLIGLQAIWLPAVLLRWVPTAGLVLLIVAGAFTWIMASAGLGAVLLSRAGTRTTFGSGAQSLLSAGSYWTAAQPVTSATGEVRNP